MAVTHRLRVRFGLALVLCACTAAWPPAAARAQAPGGAASSGRGFTGFVLSRTAADGLANPAHLATEGWRAAYEAAWHDLRGASPVTVHAYALGPFLYASQVGGTATHRLAYGRRDGPLDWGLAYGWDDAGFVLDTGFNLRVSEALALSAAVRDLAPATGESEGGAGLAQSLAGGRATLALGAWYAGGAWQPRLGLEVAVAGSLTVRAGYADAWTAGLGYEFPGLGAGLDYGVTAVPGETRHYLSIRTGSLAVAPSDRRPRVARLTIGGPLAATGGGFSLLGGRATGMDRLLATLRSLREDGRYAGILIEVKPLADGLGTLSHVEELRLEVARLREAGIPVVFYLEELVQLPEYYLASAGDAIVLADLSALAGLGRQVVLQRYTGLFERLGLQATVRTQGEYKDSLNAYSPEITDAHREQADSLVEAAYREVLARVGEARGLDEADLVPLFDGDVITGRQALEAGLVDRLGSRAAAEELVQERTGTRRVTFVDVSPAAPPPGPLPALTGRAQIAVVTVDGAIVTGDGQSDPLFGTRLAGSKTVAEQLRSAAEDPQVAAVVLRVDSPGGSAVASEEIWQAVREVQAAGKPVVASMGSVAASGGMYVSSGADHIVASPSTVTGSIGVISSLLSTEDLWEKLGVEVELFTRGDQMPYWQGLRNVPPGALPGLDAHLAAVYERFLDRVAEGRRLSREEVRSLAGGRIYTGRQAYERGLVDELGNFHTAADRAAELAGARRYRLVFLPSQPQGLLAWLQGFQAGLVRLWRGEPRAAAEYRLPYREPGTGF